MGTKISGLISNMDTDSLVEQLMEAQRTKLTKIENKQTKLTWTQEKWKDLNTKIYKLYTEDLSKLRLQGSYNTYKATSGNESAVTVTASSTAPEGNHKVVVNQLASSQIWTGGTLTNQNGTTDKLKSSSKLVDSLGFTSGTTLTIKGTKEVNLTVSDTTSINDFVKACKDAGLNASFDESSQRLYVNSKKSGEDNSFTITTDDWALDTSAESARTDLSQLIAGTSGTLDSDLQVKIDSYLCQYRDASNDSERKKIQESIYNLYAENNTVDSTKKTDDLSQITSYLESYKSGSSSSALKNLGFDSSATKIDAQDSKIVYNGVLYKQSSNSITVNGVTINAKEVTDSTAIDESTSQATLAALSGTNVSVTKDTEGTYKMVKDFITNYNALLKEMNELYYASSAKGYDPLTDDEKSAMTDDQIEKWEDKIKGALLRRDSTLDSVLTGMKSSISKSIEVTTKDGEKKNYSLASLGICTSTDYTEKGLLHIYGDEDDSTYSTETNKLMKMLEDDPDVVTQVLSGACTNLYNTLTEKMKKTSLSSALTIYNDKSMEKQQTQYAKDIKNWESKLQDMEDAYYKKFSAMETALAKLQSSTSALSSLMGS